MSGRPRPLKNETSEENGEARQDATGGFSGVRQRGAFDAPACQRDGKAETGERWNPHMQPFRPQGAYED